MKNLDHVKIHYDVKMTHFPNMKAIYRRILVFYD